MNVLSALAQILADLRAYHDNSNDLLEIVCKGPQNCPLAKSLADLEGVMDGMAREIGMPRVAPQHAPEEADWNIFVEKMMEHHGVNIPKRHKPKKFTAARAIVEAGKEGA